MAVANSVILGVTDHSSVEFTITGEGSLLQWGDQLIVGDGAGDGEGATVDMYVLAGAEVSVGGDPDAQGVLVVGGNAGDDGDVVVAEAGSKLSATDAVVGDFGNGTLFAAEGGSIDISGTLFIGEEMGATGTVQLAGADGPADATVGELDVGVNGDGLLRFSSQDGLNSGTLTVTDDAVIGVFDTATGTVFASGGSFSVGGTFVVGDEGSALVALSSSDLNVDGDLVVGNGGPSAQLILQDVDLTLGGELDVGEDGAGALTLGSSDQLSTSLDNVLIGVTENGDGTFNVEDPTTVVTIGTLEAGVAGTGTLDISNGATVEVTDDAGIGIEDGGNGLIILQTGTDDVGAANPNGGSNITFDQTLFVGDAGVGYFIIGSDETSDDGAYATVHGDLIIGNEATAFGTVTVANDYVNSDGSTVPSMLTVDQDIIVGFAATGTIDDVSGTLDPGGVLQVVNGATVDATGDGFGLIDVAAAPDSAGEVNVNGGTVNATDMTVGDGGDGALFITEFSGVFITGTFIAGDSANSTGMIDLQGESAVLQVDGDMIIGGGATAIVNPGTIDYPVELDAVDGAVVDNVGTVGADGTVDATFIIGDDPQSLAKAIIDGATLDVNDAVIGGDGSGVLEILDASTATFNGDLIFGDGTAAFGGMDVSDSDVDFFGTLDVGGDATGATINGTFIPGALLTIENTSTFLDQNDGGIEIGVGAGSAGQMIVDDSDVETTFLVVGDNGAGTLTIRNDGSVLVDPDQDVEIGSAPSSSGTVTVDGGVLTFGSELDVGGGGSGVLTITNDGTVTPDVSATDTDVFVGDEVTGTGTVTVDASFLDTDNITIGNSGSGTLTISKRRDRGDRR